MTASEATHADPKLTNLVQAITGQFHARTAVEGQKCGRTTLLGLSMQTEITDDMILWLHFTNGVERHSVNFPIPFIRDGVTLIRQNEVLRAICPFWKESEQREIDYLSAIYSVALADCTGLVNPILAKSTPYIQQVIYGFCNGNAPVIINRFQKAINEVVHRMPLHETMLNSWVMNQRLIIIDPAFDELRSPEDRLHYQVNKARKYFPYGWTALGLSDGTLADKNYILKADLRRLSPFGWRFHNPQRNLFSTLGMKGDELPIIRSQSMQDLMDVGITRHGWNFTTAFVDIPDVFEDQIMVDKSHRDKYVTYDRRFQVFGDMLVKEGDTIKCGQAIGTAPDTEPKIFQVACDHAEVKKIVQSIVNVGGNPTRVYNVVIEYRRNFRDGLKLTNLHGNKGVIRMADLGYATNPATGEKAKIDIIVGAKTVGKRKNYGQVLEALLNNVMSLREDPDEPVVLPDDWYQPMEQVTTGLAKRGYRADGTWDCDTYAGKVTAVVGRVFWGCIKTPEDQIWKKGDTVCRNGKEVRTRGLKFSHVEFRALKTRFGDDNPVLDEILSYVQGTENLRELIRMAAAKKGVLPKANYPTVDYRNVRPLDQSAGTILGGQWIAGTVVDEFFMPDGFVMTLPLPYQTLLDDDLEVIHEGSPMATVDNKDDVFLQYQTDKLYIPSGILRKCWRHDNGMYGLSEVGVIVNNVVTMIQRLLANPQDPVSHRLYYTALYSFFDQVAGMLCSKRGDISTLGMSVRYPFSAKAVATLSTTLPKNTVEIHRSMANIMNVHTGDVVLAERFPCLGFMSVRLQRVQVTDDPMCKYTIRVSGNSLVSQNLDHDGDVLFLAALHTPQAKEALRREFTNPNPTCYGEIDKLNNRKGAPHVKCYSLSDFQITPFADPTNEGHAAIVEKNTGVKAQTGPVIALTYNLMRIVENSGLAQSQKMKVAIEMFLEKAAQSVFEQKHGGKSLYEIVIDGVCMGDVEMLVDVGFKRGTTEKLCALIKEKAAAIGVFDLVKYHVKAKEKGFSNIISKIVRTQNRIYFVSRSKLEAIALLDALEAPTVDIPSEIFRWVMSGKADLVETELDKFMTAASLDCVKNEDTKEACAMLVDAVGAMFVASSPPTVKESFQRMRDFSRRMSKQRGISHAQIV
jgi:hypothetical protein